jgi:hypothetical protein
LTGSPGRPGQFFFFLNQNDVVLVKKKKQKSTGATGFFIGFLSGHTGFSFLYFFFNPARFQPRVDPSGRVRFQNYDVNK